jgi:uncharacterized integral membrane protein
MRTRTLISVIAALLIVVLLVANWGLLSATVSLNLLFARLQAPLVVLPLLLVGVMLFAAIGTVLSHTHAWKIERRRLVSDLDTARSVAEKEEESRTQALRLLVEREFAVLRAKLDRLLAGPTGALGRESALQPSDVTDAPPAIEPELIPPRPPVSRRRH